MDYETHADKTYYKVAVRGGLLNTSFLRTDLIHEYSMTPSQVLLDDVVDAHWPTMPKISVREAVKNISLTGGQGHVKCSCKTGCTTAQCACRKAERRCTSKCHPKANNCCNHDMAGAGLEVV